MEITVPDIHIERAHTLGLPAAREVARRWVRQVEEDYGLQCSYDEGERCDIGRFSRAGIEGSVEVSADRFALQATLGMLFSSFGPQIEAQLNKSLDKLLGGGTPEADDDAYNDKDWR